MALGSGLLPGGRRTRQAFLAVPARRWRGRGDRRHGLVFTWGFLNGYAGWRGSVAYCILNAMIWHGARSLSDNSRNFLLNTRVNATVFPKNKMKIIFPFDK